ncbi:sulfatase-like hydrolase/transferase [Calycomorphotria hydatis]|nr:sulfatase-like hydrolase/transferase [Calycomorphotria hydatis]
MISLLILFSLTSTAWAAPPNVMIFLVDDMGVMDTSVPFLTDKDGNPVRYPLNDYYRTPSMERLASEGIRFNQFYAMSVCSPTRISILTGQNAARHRTTNWINPFENNKGEYGPAEWNWTGLKKGDITLPGLLREAGYRTLHVGKGHFAPDGFTGVDPANLGFDINVAGNAYGAPASYYGQKNYRGKTRRGLYFVPHLEKYHGTDTFLTEAITLEARKLVRDAVEDKAPFFLYLSHYAVHGPFNSDPRFAEHYRDSGKPKNAQAFATLVEGMDKSLGDMLDLFNELGVAENTLVLFLGDNGTDAPLGHQHELACAAPLRGKKGSHYEGGMRVPFIAAWAKRNNNQQIQQQLQIPAGEIQDQVSSVMDLFPTVLNLSGIESPESHAVDGFPLQKLIAGNHDSSRPEQFLMHYPHGVHSSNYFTVWRDGDWKLIHHAHPEIPAAHGRRQISSGHFQLFNLADDPFESTNLAQEYPEELANMLSGMSQTLTRHKALYVVDKNGNDIRPAE